MVTLVITVLFSLSVSFLCAAAEAVILGIPAVAISLTSHVYKDFGTSSKFCSQLVKWIKEKRMEPGLLRRHGARSRPRVAGSRRSTAAVCRWCSRTRVTRSTRC